MVKIKLNSKGHIEKPYSYPVTSYSIPTQPALGYNSFIILILHCFNSFFYYFGIFYMNLKNKIIYSYFIYLINELIPRGRRSPSMKLQSKARREGVRDGRDGASLPEK